uniref:Uncharacterized protein n=1 Tax=Setaria italica TaxID=4555 RepID=K3XTU0_SETIT
MQLVLRVAGGQGVRRGGLEEGGRSTLIRASGGEVMGGASSCALTHTCVAFLVVVAYGMAPLHSGLTHGTTVADETMAVSFSMLGCWHSTWVSCEALKLCCLQILPVHAYHQE